MRRSLVVATAAVYAAMYVVLGVVFSPVSYGLINLRVANVLVGLVPLLGWPAIIGQTLGVFITNQSALGDPLGPIDLINVLPTFVFTWVVWRLRKKSVFHRANLYTRHRLLILFCRRHYRKHIPVPEDVVGRQMQPSPHVHGVEEAVYKVRVYVSGQIFDRGTTR